MSEIIIKRLDISEGSGGTGEQGPPGESGYSGYSGAKGADGTGGGESGYSGYSGSGGTTDHTLLINRDVSGAHPAFTVSTDTGWAFLSQADVNTQLALSEIDTTLAKLAPSKPPVLSTVTMSMTGYSGLSIDTGADHWCTDVLKPVGSFSGYSGFAGFYDGEKGTLTAYIDNGVSGTIDLSGASVDTTDGSLKIVVDNDPYSGVAGKQGFWKQVAATITQGTNFSPSNTQSHEYKLVHSSTGTSIGAAFYVDNPGSPVVIGSAGAISGYATPANYTVQWITGVPSLSTGDKIRVDFGVSGAVGKHYHKTKVAQISESSVAVATSGIAPLKVYAENENILVTGIDTVVQSNKYTENCNFQLVGYNSKGVVGATSGYTGSNIRVDTVSVESVKRVVSGDGQYPVLFGGTWGSTAKQTNLSDTQELQLVNGRYQYPARIDYRLVRPTSGYNYSGVHMEASLWNNIRWVTYKIGSYSDISSITVSWAGGNYSFVGETGLPFTGFQLLVKVVGATGTGWVDGNAAYSDVGSPRNDGDAALKVSLSSQSSRVVVFGSVIPKPTGDVYVRIGLSYGSAKWFKEPVVTKG